ncbi:hypothetical protein OWM07_00175 [Deferribacter thermophilus]|uniref:hypothetical protein n=1 Tax=Deferribacter thermophilus TaxID=53573 RepID=UPI003C258D2D
MKIKLTSILFTLLLAMNVFAGTLTYSPDDKSYSITFPISWLIFEQDNGKITYAVAPEKSGDPFRETVYIEKEYVGNNTNIEHYLFKALKNIKNKYPSFVKEGEKNVIIDNIYAKEIKYSVDDNGVKLKAKVIIVFTRGNALKFYFLSDQQDSKNFKNIFDEIQKSIRLR